jgi:hypothetical protein
MPDGSVDFTVRLINQASGPASAAAKSISDLTKTIKSARTELSGKSAPLKSWEDSLTAAKRSQAADFARHNSRLVQSQKVAQAHQLRVDTHRNSIKNTIADHHLQHGTTATLAEGASSAALGATYAIGAAAAAAAAAVGYLGVKFAELAVHAAKFGERATLAIGFLTNDAQQAGNAFNEVRTLAQGLGLDVDHTVEGFQKLLAAQFSVGKSKDLVKMGADMQAIGASAEEVQRIIYAMTEIKSIGSLQKRQERMLQMAGISGELIDQALMKHTGIKDKAGIDKARKGNKIGADVAIDAIMEAVMHKTHEAKLGDAGAAFANTTLAGMQQKLTGGIENFFIDVGQKILPGITTIAKLVGDTIGKITSDPQVQAIGTFLLNRFELFVDWAKANWPQFESSIIDGLHSIGDAIRFVVDAFDSTTQTGKMFEIAMWGIAAAVGAVAVAGFLLMLPLYLVIGALGALVYGVMVAVQYLTDAIPRWLDAGKGMISALVDGIMSGIGAVKNAVAQVLSYIPGGNLLVGANGVATTVEGVTAGAGIANSAASVGSGNDKTEGGKPGGAGMVHIASMPITVPQSDDPQKQAALIGSSIRTELQKILHPG